jgi:hypothetical protein
MRRLVLKAGGVFVNPQYQENVADLLSDEAASR